MPINRRDFLRAAVSGAAIATAGPSLGRAGTLRIATEETFGIPEIYDATARYINDGAIDEAGLGLPPRSAGIVGKLLDLGIGRIADMDAAGVDRQLLSLWSPGVQIFDPVQAAELARLANDRLAGAISKNVDRLSGLVTVAPQDPSEAAREIERGMTTLSLNGVLINSYTKNEFLDDRKFWPIFEAAVAYDAAIYLHPRKPSSQMYAPYSAYSMDGAMWGFHSESSTHAIRLLLSGVFDEFPSLTIALGHMGEGLPFWLDRLDKISAREQLPTIKRKPSEYFLDNFVITTSGMFWDPILELSLKVLGEDRILFGVDYPFADSKAGVDWLDDAAIPERAREKMFSGNAQRVFHLPD